MSRRGKYTKQRMRRLLQALQMWTPACYALYHIITISGRLVPWCAMWINCAHTFLSGGGRVGGGEGRDRDRGEFIGHMTLCFPSVFCAG